MNALTLQFAKDNGCPNPSAAQIKAFEKVRQHGIQQARKSHYDRKRVTDAIKNEPALISGMMYPAQSIDEALEDISAALVAYLNMPSWRRENHAAAIRKAKANRVYFRFFRRYADRIMAREAA